MPASLHAAPVAMLWASADGQVQLAAGAALPLLGIDERVQGRPLDEVLPPPLAQGPATGAWFDAEVQGRTWEVSRTRSPSGELVLAHEVSAARRAEASSLEELRFLEAILEHLPDMIFVKDARDLRFVRVNCAAEALLGFPREALIGKGDHDFFPPAEADFFTSKDRAVLQSGRPLDIPEERIHTGSGDLRLLHTRKIPLLDAQGAPRYLLGLSQDITERKQTEREREELVAQLEELDQLKIRFISDVSHELRTPLALISGLTERVLEQGRLDAARRRDLRDVLHAVHLLRGLVDDLLEVSRLDEGHATLHYVEVDLARQTRLTAGAFDSMASARNIRLAVEAPVAMMGQVDLDKFDRILINLLANALRFTPPGGEVRCTLSEEEGQVVLGVQDTGPGVPADQREEIFDRFHTGRGTQGIGLGLAIVRELALLHGGDTTVRDAAGGGACFEVRLPRYAPGGSPVSAPVPPANLPSAPPVHAGSPHPTSPHADDRPLVLVVEDNPEMNRLLAELMEPEYAVATAFDGAEGLEKARSLTPDLVLTDLSMPRLGGDQLLAALRRDPRLAYVPVIVLTARKDASPVKLLQGGAQDYVTKPFSNEELQTRVRNAITVKRARDLLQRELASRDQDLEVLAGSLAERTRELESALETAVVARQQAERALRLRAEFLGLIAHEVRTPIHALRLGLDVLQRQSGGAPVPPEVERVVRAGDRLHRIVESILEYATVESARAQMKKQPVDLVHLVEELAAVYRDRARAKGLRLRLTLAPDLPTVHTDPALVRLILSNLLDNAVKFTHAGAVTVLMDRQRDGVLIRVRDTGPGIEEEELQRLFEPFVHLTPLRTKHQPGTGLGLALVRDIATSLGGRVTVDSTPGVGSTFSLFLPDGISHARGS